MADPTTGVFFPAPGLRRTTSVEEVPSADRQPHADGGVDVPMQKTKYEELSAAYESGRMKYREVENACGNLAREFLLAMNGFLGAERVHANEPVGRLMDDGFWHFPFEIDLAEHLPCKLLYKPMPGCFGITVQVLEEKASTQINDETREANLRGGMRTGISAGYERLHRPSRGIPGRQEPQPVWVQSVNQRGSCWPPRPGRNICS